VSSADFYAALAAASRAASRSQNDSANHSGEGCSQKEAVWQAGKMTLYRYRSIARPAGGVPLLIVYALVNRPYMMDLQEDRSLIRGLLAKGLDVYLIDWGYPDGADRFNTLADYIEDYLAACVDQILRSHRLDALNVLGVCQGGVLSVCFSALHPTRVRNLITMVTPVDFHTPADLLSKWAGKIDIAAWVANGNVSGDVLNQLFLALMPFRLTHQKYVDLLTGSPDPARLENFMRVEKWIFDSPDQAGAAFQEFVRWFYQENRLVQRRLTIGGRDVDLHALKMPILNLIGKRDHLVPPEASAALQRLVGSEDYTALEFDLGHIGMYIRARAQREVPEAIAQWLSAR
jgi:polyhydroxyalkanoate synthase